MDFEPLDTSDIDRWIGQPIGGEQLKEPITVGDLRRWVQAMHNPNPVHYDETWPRAREAGGLIAPQSMILACAIRHGTQTSMQGGFEGVRQMNGGDEWWFYKTVSVGDLVTSVRLAFDYKIRETPFAGPTIFQRGDITYINQHGQVLARQRSTSIRWLQANFERAAAAKAKPSGAPKDASEPVWTSDQIAGVEEERLTYARGLREGASPTLEDIAVGTKLPRRVIGPHSIQSFTTEQRSFLYTAWGALYDDGIPATPRKIRAAEAAIDPYFADGLYQGASAGHTDSKAAGQRGMPRAYGAGGAICAYVVDYVSNWAGERGRAEHLSVQYRNPVLVGDLTYVSGEVVHIGAPNADGYALVDLSVQTADQNGKVGTPGKATVRLPARRA